MRGLCICSLRGDAVTVADYRGGGGNIGGGAVAFIL